MTKLIVDELQRQGGPTIKLPTTTPTGSQYIQSDETGQLSFTNQESLVLPDDAILAGSSPVIFAINTCYTRSTGTYGWSSELGQWNTSNASYALYKLAVATGRNDWGAANGGNYSNYNLLPEFIYPRGSYGDTTFIETINTDNDTTNRYSYTDKLLQVVFLKNPTGSAITTNIKWTGTSYSGSYNGLSLDIFTPDAASNPSTINHTNLYSYTSSTNKVNTSNSITVQPGFTVAVVGFSSAYYFADSSGYNFHFGGGFYDLKTTTLNSGLIVDIPKTVRALTNPLGKGTTSAAELADIWRA
jgi:hypothetical protein